jgi:hypothetical protein
MRTRLTIFFLLLVLVSCSTNSNSVNLKDYSTFLNKIDSTTIKYYSFAGQSEKLFEYSNIIYLEDINIDSLVKKKSIDDSVLIKQNDTEIIIKYSSINEFWFYEKSFPKDYNNGYLNFFTFRKTSSNTIEYYNQRHSQFFERTKIHFEKDSILFRKYENKSKSFITTLSLPYILQKNYKTGSSFTGYNIEDLEFGELKFINCLRLDFYDTSNVVGDVHKDYYSLWIHKEKGIIKLKALTNDSRIVLILNKLDLFR